MPQILVNSVLSYFKAKEQNIDGNMKGDGFQNGGVLVVKAGKCLGRLCTRVYMHDRIVLNKWNNGFEHILFR